MTTPDIQQAKEWATEITESRQTNIRPDAFAAAEVIQSLPDHWISADKLREVIEEARLLIRDGEPEIILNDLVDLITPPLPTMAELIEAGNKPEDYQWSWVDTEDGLYVVTSAGDFDDEHAYVMDKDGRRFAKGWSQLKPRPDITKLEWPGGGVEDAPAMDDEPIMVSRPEDVPSGQPWLVEFEGDEWVGVRSPDHSANVPWVIIRMDGLNYGYVADFDITLISRMVPEPQP